MPGSAVNPLVDPFMAAAEEAARTRPDVDLELARELLTEAATMLHNGLALDGLDEHDTDVVVSGLCADLIAVDPGAALRARSPATSADPGDLHDPESAAAVYLFVAAILQI